ANGNYVFSLSIPDSLFQIEADPSFNAIWYRYQGKYTAAGGSVVKNNAIYSLRSSYQDLVLTSTDLLGNSCSSYSMSFSSPTTTAAYQNITLSPASFSLAVVSGTLNVILPQQYTDSCKCPVMIPVLRN